MLLENMSSATDSASLPRHKLAISLATLVNTEVTTELPFNTRSNISITSNTETTQLRPGAHTEQEELNLQSYKHYSCPFCRP